jgi:hypothetical protein
LIFVASDLSTSSTVISGVVRVRTNPTAETVSESALAATLSGRSAMMTTSSWPNA